MHRPWWQASLEQFRESLRPTTARKAGGREYAKLSLRRLEDRRVLDGAAVAAPPPVTITEDAGAVVITVGPADGSADVFDVLREEAEGKDLLQVKVNGTLVFTKSLDQVASVTINGSSDQETLVVDFGNGDPIPVGGINFAGAGDGSATTGADSVMFVNGAADSVAYSLSGSNEGQVSLTAGGTTSSIEFSNVNSVTDSLLAESRSFTVGGTIADATLSAGGMAGTSQLSSADGLQVTFANPTSALGVQDATAAGLAITVNGLDSQFQADLTIAGGQASVVQFTGPTAVGAGDVHVTGGTVTIASSLSSLGGTIEISAYEQVVVSQSGSVSTPSGTVSVAAPSIQVDGTIAAVDGGHIRLDAGLDGTLVVSGHLDASSTTDGMTGGTVDLLGARVGLTGHAVVDVSGSAGGGNVRIGGDWHGSNAQVQSALRTYIGSDVVIRADALVNGNGGSVVVWSDEVTGFYGQIVARGGAQGGAGGSVEVSSADLLLYRGYTDLTAAAGSTGTVLLDPLTITIVDQAGGADDIQLNANVPNPGDPAGAIFYGDVAAGNFTISETAIEASAANIVLQARNTITIGNLTTDGVLLLQPNVNLTLQTRNNVAMGGGETSTGGIVFANTANTIQTQGTGTITLNAGTAIGSTADILLGNLQTAGGQISVIASQNVTVAGNTASNGGNVTLIADAFAVGTGTFTVNAGNSVSTSGGSLTIASADISLAGTLNSGAGTTTLQATNLRTVGIGLAAGQYGLSGAELQNITAGNLVIGAISNNFINGNITADGVTAANVANIAGTITLRAPTPGRTVTFSGAASNFKALTVIASDGVFANTNLTTTGALTISADSNNNGVGTFSIAAAQTVDSSGNAISVTAADVALSGFLNSGVGTTTLQATINRTIGIGDVVNIGPAGAQFALSGSELQNITAGDLIVGGATSGNITVDAVTAAQVAGVAGTVTLRAPTAGTTITFSGGASTFKTLSAQASDGVSVNTDLTTTGSLTVNADTNIDGVGTFSIAALNTVNSTGNAISVTAADINLAGFLNSGAGTTTLEATKNRTIGIGDIVNIGPAGAQFALSGPELQNITAGNLIVGGATSGNITVDAVTAVQVAGIAGTVTLQAPTAGRTITFSGGASTFKTLTALAADGVSVNANLTTTGVLTIDADSNADAVGTFTTAVGTAVDTTSQLLSITAADVTLAGTLNSGSAITLIRTSKLGIEIDLGTNTVGKLSLTDGELDLITADTIRIGRDDALASGQITVSDVITPAGTTRLHLITGAGVGTTGAGAIVENELAISASGPVSLLNANDVDKLAAKLTGVSQPFAFKDADDLTVAIVDGVAGLVTNGGDATLILGGNGTQQVGADIHAAGLELIGSAGFNFTNAANDVSTLAVNAAGPVSYRDATDLAIGTVNATVGITTLGSNVTVEAGGNLFLNEAIAAPGAVVDLKSDAAAIVDGNGSAINITADSLALQASLGIGSGDALETAVNTLAAFNGTSGNVRIFNDVAGLLTIGVVNGLTGVQNAGGGFVEVINNGSIVVNATVSNVGGGDVTLTALTNGGDDDHLILNAVVQATGGNGNIYLNGGTDLVINDSGSAIDVLTENNGEIFGLAQRVVVIGSNVIIQTGVGAISTLYPALEGVKVPQLTAWGVATLTGFFGDPGAHNFTITIDWADGTFETFHFDDPGTFTFTHTYTANPNPSDQSAPIPVTVSVYDDPNSHFVGMQQPPVTFTINTTDSKTIGNEFDIVTTFTNTPGEGLGIFRIDTSLHIIPPLFPALPVLTYLFDSPGLSSLDSGGFAKDGATFEEAVVEARQVLLVTVDPQGVESEPVVLDEGVLDDLPGLFRRLPDGHYKIYLREIGEQRVRLLIDVNLRGGKPSDASESSQDKPPTVEVETDVDGAWLPSGIEAESLTVANSASEFGADAALVSRLPALTFGETLGASESAIAMSVEEPESASTIVADADLSVACGAVAMGMIQSRRSWAERVDRALGDSRSGRLSKGARLARRVRRRLTSTAKWSPVDG